MIGSLDSDELMESPICYVSNERHRHTNLPTGDSIGLPPPLVSTHFTNGSVGRVTPCAPPSKGNAGSFLKVRDGGRIR
jgi:hypothetical protein